MKRLETCWAQEHGSMIGAQMCILHFCMCFLVEILWLQIEIPVHYLLLGPRYLKMLQAGETFVFPEDVICITNCAQKMYLPVEKAFLRWVPGTVQRKKTGRAWQIY